MLRSNLSTRPFYNDRLVALIVALVAAGGLVLTAFNAMELRSLYTERSSLNQQITTNTGEAAKIAASVNALKNTIDVGRIRLLHNAAREANELIDKRTFSWTVFFGLIEKTLPYDARLVAVSPKVEKGVMSVAMSVVCQQSTDLQEFVIALEKTGVFVDVNPAARQKNEDGTETALIEAVYRPATQAAPPAPKGPAKGRS